MFLFKVIALSLLILIIPSSMTFVQDLPFFAAPMQNVSVRLGDVARMTCVVANLGPYQVAWVNQNSGAVLAVGDTVLTSNVRVSVKREQRNTWVLVISNVTANDVGEYMCQLSTSPPQRLFGFLFVVEPPTITWNTRHTQVEEGHSALLECRAKGKPKPIITWKREDRRHIRISESYYVPEYIGWALNLYDSSAETAGKYICLASNSHPPSMSKVLDLRVLHRPIVIPVLKEQKYFEARQGTLISLSCKFAANPYPEKVFQKSTATEVTNFTKEFIDTRKIYQDFPYTHIMTLTLEKIEASDYGNYSCIVRNVMGSDRATLVLKEDIQMSTSLVTTPIWDEKNPMPLLDGSILKSNKTISILRIPKVARIPKEPEKMTSTISPIDTARSSWSKKIARIHLIPTHYAGSNRAPRNHRSFSLYLLYIFIIVL